MSRRNARQVPPADDARPTVAELREDSVYAKAAQRWWLREKDVDFNPATLKKEIYDLLEREKFPYKGLLILETLQLLERYLWPNFNEKASDYHVMLITLMVNVKRRENFPIWEQFEKKPEAFATLFRRVITMCIDSTQALSVRSQMLGFVVTAIQSLDSSIVRKECASLFSIATWQNLGSEKSRNALFERYPQTRKAWRASSKRFDATDDNGKAKLRFERQWLYQMILNFYNLLYQDTQGAEVGPILDYCQNFIELLIDLESQLPTRRYVNTLLKDLHILPSIKLSPVFAKPENTLLRDLFDLLSHYVNFPIDDFTAEQLSTEEARKAHNGTLARLQRIAFRHFKEKLLILALSNYGSISQRDELAGHLAELSDEEVVELASFLDLRTEFPSNVLVAVNRAFHTECLLSAHERKTMFQEHIKAMPVLPNEKTLFQDSLLEAGPYDGLQPLALPKLNLQYLAVGDFLWRSFVLYRNEAFYSIRQNLEETIKRSSPKFSTIANQTIFHSFCKMSLAISRPSILEVLPPKVGHEVPAAVRAEILLNLSRMSDDNRREWESLRPDDVVFLLGVKGISEDDQINGRGAGGGVSEKYGIQCLRAAEVVAVLDSHGTSLTQGGFTRRSGGQVRLHVKIDPYMYAQDAERTKAGKPDVYDTVNMLIRRRGRENTFKPRLECIQQLMQDDLPLPSWFREVFLGYGDPSGAHYTNVPGRPTKLDFRDTFLDWDHLVDSLPEKSVIPVGEASKGCDPPYVIKRNTKEVKEKGKKRRRGTQAMTEEVFEVSTYKLPNMGPYPIDQPRKNPIRFTPIQVEAITSGTSPGLTVIVGPPGTGKTDVATQVISNIYHNFPKQRTLLIAHSNQALNQLFDKITILDLDERHLLRLGHGEEDLRSGASFSKQGRVETFMENRGRLLAEVDRLASCLSAPGAHGDSCETAGYFNSIYVLPAWAKFQAVLSNRGLTVKEIREKYPFNYYFSNAPTPMFPDGLVLEDAIEVALGGYRHIEKIFSELEDIRPFELLRHPKDQQKYLLLKEARVIAMTSTHAAIKRQEIADLGFRFDNVVMEESAQITEIESFTPLCLQHSKSSKTPLQRICLIGDHYQNSPVLQNLPLKQYANFDQSLFARLIRLGVPVVQLNAQGRARPSIASLYSWSYNNLTNLPFLAHKEEFQRANAGFKHEFQFINVEDYNGAGETEPNAHFIQNLGEAEYAVAIFQYMRLLGYPAEAISILTTYAGQRALIRDVLARRCGKIAFFGWPKALTTVDKYQGEQNDFVILSLVRTKRIGYLRDLKRMTVALSRARLGLYVLGRKEVLESCHELAEPMRRLMEGKSERLVVTTKELYPCERKVGDEVAGTEMVNVEHMGMYVFEMSKTKIQSLKEEQKKKELEGELASIREVDMEDGLGEGDEDEEEEEEVEEEEEEEDEDEDEDEDEEMEG